MNGTRESADLALAYNDFWWERRSDVVETRRTSLVVDPPSGRVPPLTEAGSERAAERVRVNQRLSEGPEDRPLDERCISGFNSGPPSDLPIFEYACHEGNYGMEGTLSGARALERQSGE